MNLHGGKPFWPVRNGLLAVYPALAESIETEVAIIGAGVTGALVAWHLTEAGIPCTVVDRRDATLGSTCASTALLQYEIDVPMHQLAERIGEKDAVRAYRCSFQALQSLSRVNRKIGAPDHFRTINSLQGAAAQKQVRGLEIEHEWRLRHGFASKLWTGRDLRRRSSLPFHVGLHTPDAAQMDPHQFASALLAKCAQRGVRIFDRTEITQRKVGSTIRLKTKEGATIRAKHLVVAAGYETEPELPTYLAQLYSTFAYVTEPIVDVERLGWLKDHVIWEAGHPYHYLRQTDDDRILIGGGDIPYRGAQARDNLLPRKRSFLVRRLQHLFPKIPAEPAYAWSGTFAETRDGLPCIGRCPQQPGNVYYTLGYGGNGITFSLIAAEIIRDLVCGETPEHLDLFRMDRPSLRAKR